VSAADKDRAHQDFLTARDAHLFWGAYHSWDDAAAAAASYGRSGYDNPESAELYRHLRRIDAYDYPSLYWLTRSFIDGRRSVFDVGGSIGVKFYAFKDLLDRYPDVRWHVTDVPAAVALGRQLAAESGVTSRLSFADAFAQGEGCDVLFASGVLQYLPQTLPALLASWRTLPARLLINTTAIHPQREYFTVNNIGTAFCPYRVQTQAALIRGLSALGYRLRESWTHPGKPLTLPFEAGLSLDSYRGFLLDLVSKQS
jgi:putative methyltransferase (TIGR04325 family)